MNDYEKKQIGKIKQERTTLDEKIKGLKKVLDADKKVLMEMDFFISKLENKDI